MNIINIAFDISKYKLIMKGMKILYMNQTDNYEPLVPYMPENPVPGYAYVPYQINPLYFNNINEAFVHGTVFPELVTPYSEFFQRGVQS